MRNILIIFHLLGVIGRSLIDVYKMQPTFVRWTIISILTSVLFYMFQIAFV